MSARSVALAPMGLFDILVRSIWLSWVNLPALVGLGLIVFVPIAVVGYLASLINVVLGVALGFGLLMIGALYYYAASTLLIALASGGTRVNIFQLLRHLRGRVALDIFGTSLLMCVAVYVGVLLLVVPGIILLVRWVFACPVIVLEGVAYRQALKRSSELVAGRWWRTAGAVALLYALFFAIETLVGLLPLPPVGRVVASVIAEIGLLPCMYVFPIMLYFDARARKDGCVDFAALEAGA